MVEQRRTLTEGLAATAPAAPVQVPADTQARAVEFLEGAASSAGPRAMRAAAVNAAGANLNTRIHPDLSTALKRASLQRKLEGVEPNTLRDMVEAAVRPWLRDHGYLP